jgi:methionine-S-sulfoxide reductase
MIQYCQFETILSSMVILEFSRECHGLVANETDLPDAGIMRITWLATFLVGVLFGGFGALHSSAEENATPAQTKTAVLAGGCFWCIQPAFDKAPGVINTVVGYCGGTEPNPTYELVGSERTKYRESLEITYDPSRITYEQLLDIYWKQIDPTQANGQFSDIGPSYRAAIFYQSDEEKNIAETSKQKLAKSGKFKKPIVTEIIPATKFYPAEEHHQKYYRKNASDFEAFEEGSGRNAFHKKAGEEH